MAITSIQIKNRLDQRLSVEFPLINGRRSSVTLRPQATSPDLSQFTTLDILNADPTIRTWRTASPPLAGSIVITSLRASGTFWR